MGAKVRAFSAALASLLLLATSTTPASARVHPVVPFNNPALNQYLEIIPTSSGGRPSNGVSSSSSHGHKSGASGGVAGGGGGSGPGAPLAPATVKTLSNAGAQGRQAVALATATAPPAAGSGHHGTSGTHRAPRSGSPAVPPARRDGGVASSPASSGSESSLSQVVGDVTGSSGDAGMGLALPVTLVLLALGAVGIRLRQRRRTQP